MHEEGFLVPVPAETVIARCTVAGLCDKFIAWHGMEVVLLYIVAKVQHDYNKLKKRSLWLIPTHKVVCWYFTFLWSSVAMDNGVWEWNDPTKQFDYYKEKWSDWLVNLKRKECNTPKWCWIHIIGRAVLIACTLWFRLFRLC